MREKSLELIQTVFRRVFGMPDLMIDPHTNALDIQQWDSMTHIELIAEIEHEFNVEFLLDEVLGFTCVDDMLNCVLRKQVAVN